MEYRVTKLMCHSSSIT